MNAIVYSDAVDISSSIKLSFVDGISNNAKSLIISSNKSIYMPRLMKLIGSTGRNNRKRLFLDINKIKTATAKSTSVPYAGIISSIIEAADAAMLIEAPAIDILPSDMAENASDCIPNLIFSYLYTGDTSYLTHAISHIDSYLNIPVWGEYPDLVTAHIIVALSIAYDWGHEWLGVSRLRLIESKLKEQAGIFYDHIVKKDYWWAQDYLQGHNYYNVMSIAIAGISLFDQVEEAHDWIDAANENMRNVVEWLSPDGSSHEGVGYCSGGVEALLMQHYAVLCIDKSHNILTNSSYLQNFFKFRLHMSSPGYREIAPYADSQVYEWKGPGANMRAIAAVYNNQYAQWLAETVEHAIGENPQDWMIKPKYSWLDLFFFDSKIKPISPENTENNHAFFENIGLFSWRSGWDSSAMWLLYKAAPPQGWLAYNQGKILYSHIHPDNGQVILYKNGKWLLRDDCYNFMKLSSNHNVITVNDVGQLGEGGRWFGGGVELNRKAVATILTKHSSDIYHYIASDNTILYPQAVKLAKWHRHIIVIEDCVVIIYDDVELSAVGDVKTLFHMHEDALVTGDSSIILDGDGGVVNLKQIFPDNVNHTISAYSVEMPHDADHGTYTGSLLTVLDAGALIAKNIYIINDTSGHAVTYTVLAGGSSMDIEVNNKNYNINFINTEVKLI